MITKERYYKYGDNIYKVNGGKNRPLRVDILRSIFKRMEYAFSKSSKLFVYRFDLRLPDYTDDNSILEVFNRRLFRRIKRHYQIAEIDYVWCREIETAKQQHYHYALILSAHKVRHPKKIQEFIEAVAISYDFVPQWSAYHSNVYRTDHEKINEVTYHLSYLAKSRGKGYRAIQTKDYGGSKVVLSS